MTCPGTPQIQNIIPTQTLGTTTMSGAVIGIIAGIFMFIVGYIWLNKMIKVLRGGSLGSKLTLAIRN